MGNQERGIIGPSEKDIQEVNDPNRQPSFWTRVSRSPLVRGAAGVLGLGTLGVADVSCVSPKTVEVRPTATAVGVGPETKTGNERFDRIAELLANPETRSGVPEPDILDFNTFMGQRAEATKTAGATATAEAQKPVNPLPDVINNQNTNFVQPPLSEIQILTNTTEGKGKTPLPDIVKNNSSISVKEVTNTGGFKALAIVSAEKGIRIYGLPALKAGRVAEISMTESGKSSTSRIIGIKSEDGSSYAYVVPDNASSNLKVGDWVEPGQIVITFNYDPNSVAVKNFNEVKVRNQYQAPDGTIAFITAAKGIGENDILTSQGATVVVGPVGKG